MELSESDLNSRYVVNNKSTSLYIPCANIYKNTVCTTTNNNNSRNKPPHHHHLNSALIKHFSGHSRCLEYVQKKFKKVVWVHDV